MKSKVSLVKAENRYKCIFDSLKLIEAEVKNSLRHKKIIIKPNFVSTRNQLAATHVEHVKAILDFLKEFYDKEIIIAEGAALGNTFDGFRNFNYLELKKEYKVEFLDLNEDDYEEIEILNSKGEKFPVRISKTMLDKNNYIISAAKLKTHDTVIVTLSLKNVVVGSILNGDKSKIHQGFKAINYNLFLLAKMLKPNLASIDGFIGMQGNGPVNGEPIEVKVGIASTDFLAAERIACEIMGFDFDNIGYLSYCAKAKMGNWELDKIEVVGEEIENCRKKFKPHSSYSQQLKWK